jgi:O-glycosyl hydrolase
VVKQDAFRVATQESLPEGVQMTAFVNPDSSLAVVAVNRSEQQQDVVVRGAKREFTLTIPAGSIASARWEE